MSIQEITKPVLYLKKDSDGYTYAIPANEEFAFTMAVEEIENAEWGSFEWSSLCQELSLNYEQYRKD